MKLKSILMSLASLLGASILIVPMVENSRELAQTYRLDNESNATSNQTNDLVGVDPTSVLISGPETIDSLQDYTGSSFKQYRKTVLPLEADQSVSWSLENNTQGDKITMDVNGYLTWANFLDVGTYNLTIKATSNVNSAIFTTKDVTLNILARPVPTGFTIEGPDTMTVYLGQNLVSDYYRLQNIEPSDADYRVIPSIENNPDPITIQCPTTNTKTLWRIQVSFWSNSTLDVGTYNLVLKATSLVDLAINATKNVTLNVLPKPAPTSAQIDGPDVLNGTLGIDGRRSYLFNTLPSYANKKVTWSLENNTQGENIYLAEDTIYVYDELIYLNWTNLLALGTYNLVLKATSLLDSAITATKNITLNIEPQPAPTSIVINGDAVLNGISGSEGSSTYNVTTTPTNANNDVTWSFEINYQPDKILIDQQGNLTWSDNLSTGTHIVRIKAVSNLNSNVSANKYINLVIKDPLPNPTSIQITGPDTLSGTMGTAGSSSYTASVLPNNADSNVTWSLENNNQGDKISINQSGVLSWTSTLNSGNYNFTIKVTSAVLSSVSATKNVTLTIAYDTPQLGNITLTGDGVSGNNINLTYGEPATIQATCPILNEANVDPNIFKYWEIKERPYRSIQIDSTTGEITIPANVPVFTNESLEIVYYLGGLDSNAVASQTLIANLTISYANPTSIQINGSDTLVGTLGTAGSSSYSTRVLPENANPNVTWSLENNNQGNNISINQSGVLSWNNTLNVGSYNFTIKAVSVADGSIAATRNVSLAISRVNPTSISINGSAALNGTFGIAGSSSYSASVLPNDADQNVSWSLENNTQGNNISINQSGVLSWNNTLNAGTYNLTIKATSTALTTVSASKNVTLIISYEQPQLGEITFNGDVNDQFEFTWKSATQRIDSNISINNENNVDPSLRRSWSIENNPNNNAFEIDSTNGNIWINTSKVEPKIYNFNVVFSIGNMTKSKPLTVNIVYAPIQNLTILGNDQLEGLANTYGQAVFSASVNPDNASNLVTWKLQNNPGAVTIDAHGNLKWNNLLVGTYTFDVVATSTFDSNVFQTLTVTLTILPAPEKPSNILSDSIYAIIWGPALAILIIGLIVIAAYKIKQIKNLALE